jgi:hypothetical protein
VNCVSKKLLLLVKEAVRKPDFFFLTNYTNLETAGFLCRTLYIQYRVFTEAKRIARKPSKIYSDGSKVPEILISLHYYFSRNVLGVGEWNSVSYKGQKYFSWALIHTCSGIQPPIRVAVIPCPRTDLSSERAPMKETGKQTSDMNLLSKNNIWSQVPEWARHQD